MKDRTPIIHRFKTDAIEQVYSKSPNPCTQEYDIEKLTSSTSNFKTKYKKSILNKNLSEKIMQTNKTAILLRENAELRKQIVQLKVKQFYLFDNKKLVQLLIEVENLRNSLKKTKEELEKFQIENDFLQRANEQLKSELQKFQHAKIYEKMQKQSYIKSLALSPRNSRNTEISIEKIIQRQSIQFSKPNESLQQGRKLRQSKSTKSTTKKAWMKLDNALSEEYLLHLSTDLDPLNQVSPKSQLKKSMILIEKNDVGCQLRKKNYQRKQQM